MLHQTLPAIDSACEYAVGPPADACDLMYSKSQGTSLIYWQKLLMTEAPGPPDLVLTVVGTLQSLQTPPYQRRVTIVAREHGMDRSLRAWMYGAHGKRWTGDLQQQAWSAHPAQLHTMSLKLCPAQSSSLIRVLPRISGL